MGLNRDKFRKIVGGITTPEPEETSAAESTNPAPAIIETEQLSRTGQGDESSDPAPSGDSRRFAMRGRPKGRKEEPSSAKTRKIKVSLFLSESLVNDLYEWAHADKIHPGEMFERALKPFHDKEAKRRNS
jgi:hypothetical protein